MTTQKCGQIYKPFSVGDDASIHAGEDLSYGLLSFLSIMRLWLTCTVENITGRGVRYLRAVEAKALQDAADIASGKTRAPALIPESARAPEAPKILLNRRGKRILARGLPASRKYRWFRYASPRNLSRTQFFELVAKLSVNGRMGVYRLEFRRKFVFLRRRNCAQPHMFPHMRFGLERDSVSSGLSPHHLWPD